MLRFRHWPQKQSKYKSNKTEVDGFVFDSKKEASYYVDLKAQKKGGLVTMFLRQVPFHLPGNVLYKLDFLVFWSKGEVEFVDVKGFKTKEYLIKKKMVESAYGISITEV